MKPSAISLLWPIAPPVAVLLAIHLYLASGEVLYAHGPSMLLLLVAVLWGGAALLWEFVAVPLAVRAFIRAPANRSRGNLAAIVASCTYIAIAFAYGFYLWRTAG